MIVKDMTDVLRGIKKVNTPPREHIRYLCEKYHLDYDVFSDVDVSYRESKVFWGLYEYRCGCKDIYLNEELKHACNGFHDFVLYHEMCHAVCCKDVFDADYSHGMRFYKYYLRMKTLFIWESVRFIKGLMI